MVLLVTAAIGVLVAGIIFWRLLGGHPIAPLSWLMPLVGLAWLSSLGVQLLRHRSAPATSAAPSDRPSRRPPSWGPPGAQRPRVTSSGDRISA